ncbi:MULTISPECIES: TadE/TadG family type IV pilus assembly protein [Actinomadura]|uniref:Septum formation initiator n=1 Tax=Actinomadura miaoliensis TaxID=430685 RepID=A0ABP7VFM1_9ACTN
MRRLTRRLVRRTPRRRDAGMLEFTAMLPLILVTVLLVWEAFLVGMAATYAGHSANEGARVAAVHGGYGEVKKAAVERVSGAWADEENIEVHYPTGRACDPDQVVRVDPDCGYVRVTIKPPLLFPGVLLPMDVSSRARVIYEGEG